MIIEDELKKNTLLPEAPEKIPSIKSGLFNFLHSNRRTRKFYIDLEKDLKVNGLDDPYIDKAELDATPLEATPPDILIGTSTRKSEDPTELKLKEDIEDSGELGLEIDIEHMVTQFFQKDIQYMIDIFERNEMPPNRQNEYGSYLRFRGLLRPNHEVPLGMPLIITRPVDRPRTDEDDYRNGSSSDIYHFDIWRDWKKLAGTYPNSRRAAVFKALDQESGAYKNSIHLYFKITRSSDNRPVIELEGGWYYFKSVVARRLRPDENNPQLTPNESRILVKQLKAYGIDSIVMNDSDERISVEKIILEDMMGPVIENNAERLRAIVTSRAASEYRNLAYKFLTNPNPDKSSPLYYKFLEYEELLLSLDTNSRKK